MLLHMPDNTVSDTIFGLLAMIIPAVTVAYWFGVNKGKINRLEKEVDKLNEKVESLAINYAVVMHDKK
jgi:outer membrane murein-binding lipoprotein Lpp